MGFFDVCCLGEEDYKENGFSVVDRNGSSVFYDEEEEEVKSVQNSLTSHKAAVALQRKRADRKTIFAAPINVATCAKYFPKHPKTKEQSEFLTQKLKTYFVFEDLQDEELQTLVEALERVEIRAGEPLQSNEDLQKYGHSFFLLEKGKVDMLQPRPPELLRTASARRISLTLQADVSALDDLTTLYFDFSGPSNNSNASSSSLTSPPPVVATTDCILWKALPETVRSVLAHHAHRRDQDIKGRLQKIDLFQNLDAATLQKFANSMTRVSFHVNDRIIQKGEIGDVFYIVEEGKVKVHDIGFGDSQSVDQILGEDAWFGERALLTGERRAANVTAITKVRTLAMDRETFEKSMGELKMLMEQRQRMQSLQAIPIFSHSSLADSEMEQLAARTTEVCYRKGFKLAEAGKPYELSLWIIRHGCLAVYEGDSGKVFKLQVGDYFGDKSILGPADHISHHDAVVEDNVTCWLLTRQDLEAVVGDLNRLGSVAHYEKRKLTKPLKARDLHKHRILGVGAFGRVWLVTTKKDKKPYAMKMINKRRLLDSKQQDGVIREKEFLAELEHPFILHLVSSFQDDMNLYLILPLIQGGELFQVVQNASPSGVGGLPERNAAFYAGCIIEALGHFHHRHIAYRDLKLENVLIDADGYCKIVDLGFAKIVVDKTYTFCGTPEYLAPEIIISKGHDKAVDYWSFGVLLYELLNGRSPFYVPHSPQMEMFKRIVLMKYSFPPTGMTEQAKDLITKLLIRRPADRLGNQARGHTDVRSHPWFECTGCIMTKLLRRELPAPWLPKVKDPMDASQFEDYSRLERQKDRCDPVTAEEQVIFQDF